MDRSKCPYCESDFQYVVSLRDAFRYRYECGTRLATPFTGPDSVVVSFLCAEKMRRTIEELKKGTKSCES